MTVAFTNSETIDAAPETVWDTITDWANGPKWLPEVETMSGPADPQVGDAVDFTARGTGRSSSITELSPNRRLILTSTQGPVTAHYRYELDRIGEKTTVALVAEVIVRGWLRVLAPRIRSSIARADRDQLSALKALVEGQRR